MSWLCKLGIHKWELYCNMIITSMYDKNEKRKDLRWGCLRCGKTKMKIVEIKNESN